jgi:hypothetical protein
MSEEVNKEEVDAERVRFKEKGERDRKRIQDPKDRFYMAGILCFGPGEFAEFTPRAMRKMDKPSVFHLRAYTPEQVAKIRQAATSGEGYKDACTEALSETGIIGWPRHTTIKGAEIPYSKEAVADLAESIIAELNDECFAYATGLLPEEAEGFE